MRERRPVRVKEIPQLNQGDYPSLDLFKDWPRRRVAIPLCTSLVIRAHVYVLGALLTHAFENRQWSPVNLNDLFIMFSERLPPLQGPTFVDALWDMHVSGLIDIVEVQGKPLNENIYIVPSIRLAAELASTTIEYYSR